MKISITGNANSGKTVFLAALIWRLQEGEYKSIRPHSFREIRDKKSPKNTFNFEGFRDALTRKGKWPEKTKDTLHYCCRITREDGWKNWGLLKKTPLKNQPHFDLFDFPGERIADSAIAAYADYESWSDHILCHFDSHADYQKEIETYLNSISKLSDAFTDKQTDSLFNEINRQYRATLARLIKSYKPLISPSTFLIDQSGAQAPNATVDALVESRYCGLSDHQQFAPVPEDLRRKYPRLSKLMARSFGQYRKEVVTPLFKEINDSKILIVLIDIASILQSGVDSFNDTRQILTDLFTPLVPKTKTDEIIKTLKFWRGLKKVAFVATKSDYFLPDDVSSGKLRALMKEITHKAKYQLPDLEVDYFDCSAIHSTRQGSTEDTLIGRPTRNNPEQKEREFKVSRLPDTWQDDWKRGDYRFMEVLPEVPKNHKSIPKGEGWDRLLNFLLES